MFGLGPGELIVILLIALLFLGPKKLPDLASTLGKAIRQFRKATNDLTDQLQVDDEVKRPIQELRAALRDEPEPMPSAGSDSLRSPGPLARQQPPPATKPVEKAPEKAAEEKVAEKKA
jgi:TatA/E family protein of Tat protein translocase